MSETEKYICDVSCRAIYEKLKTKINAGMYITRNDDGTLVINIGKSDDSFHFTYNRVGFLDLVVQCYDWDILVANVIERYKAFIIKRYFY